MCWLCYSIRACRSLPTESVSSSSWRSSMEEMGLFLTSSTRAAGRGSPWNTTTGVNQFPLSNHSLTAHLWPKGNDMRWKEWLFLKFPMHLIWGNTSLLQTVPERKWNKNASCLPQVFQSGVMNNMTSFLQENKSKYNRNCAFRLLFTSVMISDSKNEMSHSETVTYITGLCFINVWQNGNISGSTKQQFWADSPGWPPTIRISH